MTMMRRHALSLLLPMVVGALAACGSPPREEERAARIAQRFTSNEAVLVDFELDGSIQADTEDDATLRTLIQAQLMYSIGALNADRSVGRHERLELSAIKRAPSGEVTYHARLPVAWGRTGPAPSSYELKLPARATENDQTAFAAKYGETCVDSEIAGTGPMNPARMFLFYRPFRPGCTLDTNDVVTVTAKVSPSTENTTGKYPEWDRIWDDGALRVVALFSRADAVDATGTDDQGAHAFYELMTSATAWARGLPLKQLTTTGGNDGWTLDATFSDGRKLVLDARLVGHELAKESAAFDAWYDARTPSADVILYSGHAGLGWNVRTLMNKGVFRAGKYVIWAVNGCDTFAYVDRTLADRRAKLNLDDPSGTKYMDVVSNVMSGWFHTGSETTLTLVDGLVVKPKSYRDIFASIDPAQVIAVTGEEDNAFQPTGAASPSNDPYPPTTLPPEPNDDPTASGAPGDADEETKRFGGCSSAPATASGLGWLAAGLVTLFAARRRANRWRSTC
jgi:MYXO-CTERM domain-containing protein